MGIQNWLNSSWLAENMNLYHGDCLEVLPTFPPASVEAIITDLPYGTTQCSWDEVIPLADMWREVKRVLKVNGVFITTSAQPFTSVLVMSNLEMFKYDWTWNKRLINNFKNANVRPLLVHESVLVFCEGSETYNPQKDKNNLSTNGRFGKYQQTASEHGYSISDQADFNVGYPKTILDFPRPNNLTGGGYHPTQKPVALYEYLIRTYTNPSETVLDITMGSGTTGVAAIQTGRNFIGIEKEQKYFEIASRRIAQAPRPLFVEPPRQPTTLAPDAGKAAAQKGLFE